MQDRVGGTTSIWRKGSIYQHKGPFQSAVGKSRHTKVKNSTRLGKKCDLCVEKPNTKGQMLYDSTYMKYLKQENTETENRTGVTSG